MSTASTTKPETRLMTADEFLEWCSRPENENKWLELVRGEVIELPPPRRSHGVVCYNVARAVGDYLSSRGKGYVAINDAGVILQRDPDTVRGPDVAVYDDAETFEELHPKYGEVPPLLAVEVLSPDDRADQIIRKVMDYLNNGVRLVWLVDFEARIVTVYRPRHGPILLGEKDEVTGNGVLPGFRCPVAEFFVLLKQRTNRPKPSRKRGKK